MYDHIEDRDDFCVCLNCGKISSYDPEKGWVQRNKHDLFQKMYEFQVLSIGCRRGDSIQVTQSDGNWRLANFHFGVLCGKCAEEQYREWHAPIEQICSGIRSLNEQYVTTAQKSAKDEIGATLQEYVSLLTIDDLNNMGSNKQNPCKVTALENFDVRSYLKYSGSKLMKNARRYVRKHWRAAERDTEYLAVVNDYKKQLKELSDKAFYVEQEEIVEPGLPQFIRDDTLIIKDSTTILDGPLLDHLSLDAFTKTVMRKKPRPDNDTFDYTEYYWILPLTFEENIFPEDNLEIKPVRAGVHNSISEENTFLIKPRYQFFRDQALEEMTEDFGNDLTRLFLERFEPIKTNR